MPQSILGGEVVTTPVWWSWCYGLDHFLGLPVMQWQQKEGGAWGSCKTPPSPLNSRSCPQLAQFQNPGTTCCSGLTFGTKLTALTAKWMTNSWTDLAVSWSVLTGRSGTRQMRWGWCAWRGGTCSGCRSPWTEVGSWTPGQSLGAGAGRRAWCKTHAAGWSSGYYNALLQSPHFHWRRRE